MLTKKLIYINSRNRISGNHSDFSFKMDLNGIDPDFVSVLQCNIPKSYYMVQANQNTFTLSENSVDTVITIPIGNYNRINFKTTLQTLLNTNSSQLWIYAVSIPSSSSADNGKYTFTVSNNSSIQPSFTFSSTNNIYELMGFNAGSTNAFVTDVLESTNVIKLQKEDTLYINSDLVGGNHVGILQEIYCHNSADYDNIIFNNNNADLYSKNMNSANNNVYRFFLTNEDGVLMDLNGQNWTMTLVCFTKDKTNDNINQYIKFRIKK